MGIIKELLNSDMSLQAVITALALFVLISQAWKKLKDFEDSKTQYKAVNAKLDNLMVVIVAEQESSKDMRKQFGELKTEFKDQFNVLNLAIKSAFDDLHKVRNTMLKDSMQSEMNHRDLKELKEQFRVLTEKFIKIEAREEFKKGNYAQNN